MVANKLSTTIVLSDKVYAILWLMFKGFLAWKHHLTCGSMNYITTDYLMNLWDIQTKHTKNQIDEDVWRFIKH